jgi:LmbE family N-acetylglucosaminyl deacetylase
MIFQDQSQPPAHRTGYSSLSHQRNYLKARDFFLPSFLGFVYVALMLFCTVFNSAQVIARTVQPPLQGAPSKPNVINPTSGAPSSPGTNISPVTTSRSTSTSQKPQPMARQIPMFMTTPPINPSAAQDTHIASFNAMKASSAVGTTLNIVAHEDDDLLFLSPDLRHAIQSGRDVRTIFITAGDGGSDATYWQGREAGSRAAYAQICGVTNSWTQSDAGIAGHPIPVFTLTGCPLVTLAFVRLPDGNTDGSGFASTNRESLQKLWTGTLSTINAVDGSSSYTKATLTNVLTSLMTSFQPNAVNMQDYIGTFGNGDHSDHYASAYFAQAALQQYTTPYSFTGYEGYHTSSRDANVTGDDLTAKKNAFYAYGQYDTRVCNSDSSCTRTGYEQWLQRQYTVGSGSGGGGNQPPIANAGPNQTVQVNALVQLDGSASSDPGGNPLTYQWTQTSGPTVTLAQATVHPRLLPSLSIATILHALRQQRHHQRMPAPIRQPLRLLMG